MRWLGSKQETPVRFACALGVIKGDFVKAELMKLYQAKVARSLFARGWLNGSGGEPAE